MKEKVSKLLYLEKIDRKVKRKTDKHGNEEISTRVVLTFKNSDGDMVLKLTFGSDLDAKAFMEAIDLPVTVGVPVLIQIGRGMGRVTEGE